MTKKLKTIIISLVALFGLGFGLASIPAYADADICTMENVSQSVRDASGCSDGKVKPLPDVVIYIINIAIGLSSLVAVIFIIVGGFNYMTSTGESTKIEKAKKTIIHAVIGLIICILAFAIVNFTINAINK